MAYTICNCHGCDSCGDYCPEFVHRGKCDDCRRVADLLRGNGSQRGYSARWARFRRKYLAAHPLCVECSQPATDIDHKDGSGRNGPNAFSEWNLAALCHSCHSRKTATEDGGFGRW